MLEVAGINILTQ